MLFIDYMLTRQAHWGSLEMPLHEKEGRKHDLGLASDYPKILK